MEVPDLFHLTRLSETGVSNMSDNVLLLQFLRDESRVKRALTVLKTRASLHEPEIREYVTANLATEPGATTRIGRNCMLMAYAHVAHDCSLGEHVIVANAVQMAGYVSIEEWAIVGGGTVIHQFTRIGRHSMIGGGSRIPQDVAPFVRVAGSPPRMAGINRVGIERRGFSRETTEALERAYRILFRQGLPVGEAVAQIRAELPGDPAVEHFARFAETSVRGLTR